MDHTAIKEIQDTAVALAANKEISETTNVPAVVISKDHHVVGLEHLMDSPSRFRAEFVTRHLPSFVTYCNDVTISRALCLVNPNTMIAEVIFDLGSTAYPGHGEHKALLDLQETADYTAFLSIAGMDSMGQRTIAEFIEDYSDNITAYGDYQQSEEQHLGKVISTIRDVEITASSTRKSTEQDFSAARSLLEQIDAKGADGSFPALLKFSCQPYAELPWHDFYFRLRVRTGDGLSFRLARLRPEQDQETVAQQFVAELSGQLERDVLQGVWER